MSRVLRRRSKAFSPGVRKVGKRAGRGGVGWIGLMAVCGFVLGSAMFGVYWVDMEQIRSDDSRCSLRTVRSWMRTGNSTALAMIEDTGEDWVREVMERATQRSTASQHQVPGERVRFAGDGRDPRLSPLVLTHTPWRNASVPDSPVHFPACIYLARNPFDVIAIHYFREHPWESEESLTYLPMQAVVDSARRYYEHYTFWTGVGVPMLTMRFEDLLREPNAHVGELALFLGFVISDERIECAVRETQFSRNAEGSAKRDLYFATPYFDQDTRSFVVEYLSDALCQLGYMSDLAELECGAEYVKAFEERESTDQELDEERKFALLTKQKRKGRGRPWSRNRRREG